MQVKTDPDRKPGIQINKVDYRLGTVGTGTVCSYPRVESAVDRYGVKEAKLELGLVK